MVLDSSNKICFFSKKTSKISREFFGVSGTLLIAFILFWFMFPLFSYDSAWYLTYLDYFSGDRPLSEWNYIRGFTFPGILWIAHLIKSGSWGVEIVLCFFYLLWGCYLFKTLKFVKKNYLNTNLKLYDCILIFIFALMSPILWGYFHLVLTECISVSLQTVYIYYSIRFFTNRKNQCTRKYEYLFFLLFSCFMTILFWFLKQSFVVNTVFIIIIFEFLICIDKPSLKKILYFILLLICVAGSLKGSIIIWRTAVGSEDDRHTTDYFANRLNMMRYIVIESRYSGGNVSVKSDDWKTIDTFEYNYENGYLNNYSDVLKLWGLCLAKYPGRLLMGYVDNYLLMANLFQNIYRDDIEEFGYEYGPVARNQIWETLSGQGNNRDISGEHVKLLRNRMINGYDASTTMEASRVTLEENGYGTTFLDDYTNINTPNFITSFLTSKVYWTFSMMVHALLLVAAPFVCVICFGFYLKRKRSLASILSALSFYAFFFVLMHVVEGLPIDRYAIPAYGIMLVVLIMIISILIEKLRKKYVVIPQKDKINRKNDIEDKSPKILIIIPAYNEEANIVRVIENLKENHSEFDYVVVNDCSTDGTLDVCREENYHYLSLCTNLGIGGGVQTGYLYAVENGYDITVQLDGDGQHDPAYIEAMVRTLHETGADMVVGSRFLENQGFQTSTSRRAGIQIINTLIYLCGGVKVTDCTSGFRVCSKKMTGFFANHYAQDYPEPEAIVSAALHGYKVVEHPVEMRERQGGTSSINLSRSVYYMFKVTFAILLQRIGTWGER